MVKEAHKRTRKYEASIDPEKIKRNLAAVKPIMVEQQSTYFPQVAEIERKIKRICEREGIATFLIAQYINFGRQLLIKSQKFSQASFANEAQNLTDLWISRGLTCSILIDIGELFGVTVACAAPPAALVSAYNVLKLGNSYNSIIQGVWTEFLSPFQFLCGVYYNVSSVLNDEISYKFFHKLGNFTFVLFGWKDPAGAIITVLLDGVSQGTMDLYAAGIVRNSYWTLPFAILTDGEHTLNLRVTGKNPLSLGLFCILSAWWIRD